MTILTDHERKFIEMSPYRYQILPLVENPELGRQSIYDGSEASGCWGTVIHVIGAEQIILDMYQKDLESGEIICPFWVYDQITLHPLRHRPGHIGQRRMERFLAQATSPVTSYENGDILALWNPPFGLCHSAVYLGESDGDHLVFHQGENGDAFRVEKMKVYVCKYFPSGVAQPIETFHRPRRT